MTSHYALQKLKYVLFSSLTLGKTHPLISVENAIGSMQKGADPKRRTLRKVWKNRSPC